MGHELDGHSLGRYEYKYLLRPERAQEISAFLASHLSRAANTYTVRNIYFDSPELECFQEKIGGGQYGEKFRIRTYNHPGSAPLFLECKAKNGLRRMKRRVLLSAPDLKAIHTLDYDSVNAMDHQDGDRDILDKLFFKVYRQAYRPTVLVTYQREAYCEPEEEMSRVNLDAQLRGCMFPQLDQLYDEERLECLLGEWVILEIKFVHALPIWMKQLITRFRLQRQACSKYCTCVAHFLGDVPCLREAAVYV